MAHDNNKSGGNAFMQEFFGDVDIVRSNIHAIEEATKKISAINQSVILATTTEKEQGMGADLQPIIAATNKKAAVAKQLLQRLREDTERLKTTSGAKQSEIKIRENLGNTVTRKFVEVMKDYQSAQTKYKTDIKKKVKRQVQIVKPDATTEEIDAVMKSGAGSGEVFKAAILKVGRTTMLAYLVALLNSFYIVFLCCDCLFLTYRERHLKQSGTLIKM